MITFSNGHRFEYVVASGALGFTGRGWLWEWPLVWFGLIEPGLFTVVTRTLTRQPRLYPTSNLSWIRPWTWLPWSPWSCVRFLKGGGAVNKVGLYNPGINWWCSEVAPWLDLARAPLIVSLFGNQAELMEMAEMLNRFPDLRALELNPSCPNTGHGLPITEEISASVRAVSQISCHPLIIKVSVAQEYLEIAAELAGVAQAISLNSVPWEIVFPGQRSPLWRLQNRVSGGGGGVSGRPAQELNWTAVEALAEQGALPVIAPSIMRYGDIATVRALGANAISFGAIHLCTPWRPTAFVRRELREQKERR